MLRGDLRASAAFEALLAELSHVHDHHPAVQDFCALAGDIVPQDCVPQWRSCADFMAAEPDWGSGPLDALRDRMLAAAPDALWRETYAGTDIGAHFMERFGCYCIIGSGGAYTSAEMAGYLVYMPPDFWYAWHHHPAEEMYLVVSGEAEFLRHGMEAERLRAGETVFHASNQPHAMRTHDQPVLAYVIWRNNLGIKPVLTSQDELDSM